MEIQVTKAYLKTPRTQVPDFTALVKSESWKLIAQAITRNVINYIHNSPSPEVVNPVSPTQYLFYQTRDMTPSNINSVVSELKKILSDSTITMETSTTNINNSTTINTNYIKISWA
jgi:hypothetical protein